MSFHSAPFAFLFIATFFAYWASSETKRARFAILFVASCVFYMSWNARYIVLVLFSAFLDYYVGRAIHRSSEERRRKRLLFLSLFANLGLLSLFKYSDFVLENLHAAASAVGLAEGTYSRFDLLLPVGISFYTFQTLSYTIDIYRREIEPTDSLLKFSLFVSFFPQLVAGPIVRAKEFLPQLDSPARLDDSRVARGLFRIQVGLVKKVVFADLIGELLVEPVYADCTAFHPLEIVLGVYGALFQFYLDFSAYSDIAIGTAACLGFTLPENFRRPFLAQGLREFWGRWHISMTSWFRDYVFFSLGGTRSTRFKVVRNLMITLLLTGLWHGAGWNYVIWGGMYGVAIVAGFLTGRTADRSGEDRTFAQRLGRRAVTFHFVALSMLFFRNGTVAEGNNGVEGSIRMLGSIVRFDRPFHGVDGLGLFLLSVAALIHFTPTGWIDRTRETWGRLPSFAQASVLVFLTGCIGAMAAYRAPFIYFQF